MELRVAGHEVLLTLHRAYCTDDDSLVLQSVAKFKPLVDYLTRLNTDGFQLATLTIRNVEYVAQRIVQVTVDALFAAKKSRDTVTETLTLNDDNLCVYFPIATCNGSSYGVLLEQDRVPCGGRRVAEAFVGAQTKPGSFHSPFAQLLIENNFPVDGLASMTPQEVVVGNEGMPPLKFLTATKEFTDVELAKLSSTAIDGARLVVTSLEDILAGSADVKASTGAAFALSSR